MKNAYWKKAQSARARSRAFTKPALFAFVLALNYIPMPSQAATAPPATLMYTAPNNASIHGGVATIGSSGASYFTTLSTVGPPSTKANVTALNLNGSPK